MKAVTAKRLAEHITVAAPVSTWSTVRVRENTYSVPSRLIGQTVQARVFEDRADRCYAQAVPTVRPPSPARPGSAYAACAKGDFPLWKPAGVCI